MKLIKFGQSCLLIEKDDRRLVIDPGSFFADKHSASDLGKVDAVLYTHEHPDHYDEGIAKNLLLAEASLYANRSTADIIGDPSVNIVADGEVFETAGFRIQAVEIPHFDLPEGYGEPPPNTAYIIDGSLIHPGDSAKHRPELLAPDIALTIGGPTGEQFVKEAAKFAQSAGAKRLVPIHYDHFKADPQSLAELLPGAELIILADGESTEL